MRMIKLKLYFCVCVRGILELDWPVYKRRVISRSAQASMVFMLVEGGRLVGHEVMVMDKKRS